MKVVFTVGGYWPSAGGVQIVTKYLCEELVSRGHSVTVLTSLVDDRPREESHNGVQIIRFYEKDIFKIHTGDKGNFQNTLLEMKDEIDCLVTVCAQSFASEWMWGIMDWLPCKKVLYMHGMRSPHLNIKKISGIKKFLKELLLVPWWRLYFKRNWKYIIKYDSVVHLFKNDTSYNYFVEKGYINNGVINNSCDDVFFDRKKAYTISEKYGIKGEYFICVANYDSNKNQIAAYKAFVKSGVDKNLIFVGSKKNDYTKKLKSIIKHDNVKVLVGIPREDTINLIKNSYATILASQSEYFPLTIVEGIAAGRPFICSNVGVVPMIPGGVIVHDSNEMSYWIRFYSDNREYVEALGKLGHEYALKNLKKDRIVDQLERILS